MDQSPCNEQPAVPNDLADRQKQCDDEFARYTKEREFTVKNELEAEKNYDTTLATLSGLAIGWSVTIYKDFVAAGAPKTLIAIAWVLLGTCLITALIDRLLSYLTHKQWRDLLDDEFNNWLDRGGVGAWERVLPKYDQIKFVTMLPKLKWVSFGTVIGGIFFVMLFAASATPAPKEALVPPQPVTVNVYAATTQPTTQPAGTGQASNP